MGAGTVPGGPIGDFLWAILQPGTTRPDGDGHPGPKPGSDVYGCAYIHTCPAFSPGQRSGSLSQRSW